MRVVNTICLAFLLGLIWCGTLYSQSSNSNQSRTFKRAVAAADKNDYNRAITLYSQILEESPDDLDALIQLGICLMATNQRLDSAISCFHRALAIIPAADNFSPFGVELQRTLAHTYNLNYQPGKALEILSVITDSLPDGLIKEEVYRDMMQMRNGAVLLKNPVPLKITRLGEAINSEYDDHSPLVSLTGNRIFFTSRRPAGRDQKLADGQYPEKVFFADHDGEAFHKPEFIKAFFTRTEHKSVLSLSPDGSQIFLYKHDRQGKNIYVSNFRNGQWQEPEKLPFPINSQWDETHASLSSDQSTLYFTSNRPGGFGGLDIYMVKKDLYGNWGEAINLGSGINTLKDEETPMLHPDGTTLYFASEGHSSMGGFDVFFSQKEPDGKWTSAVNMGYPINSPDDDFFFVPSLDKSQAYFASYRFSDNTSRSNIYKVNFETAYSGSLAVIEGTISNSRNLPPEHIRILVSRESDNRQVGDFRPNSSTGKYLLFLEAGQNYIIQEVSPDAFEEEKTIYIPDEIAFNSSGRVVMIQDDRMLSPLVPETVLTESKVKSPDFMDAAVEPIFVRNDTVFTVQILALKVYPQAERDFFTGLDIASVTAYEGKDGFLRYVIGQFRNRDEAQQYLSVIQRNGRFRDAWIREWDPLADNSRKQQVSPQ
jgi:Tol biopolymer transport system component